MKKVAAIFIVLISINMLCTAQTLKTSVEKSDDIVKQGLNKTNSALLTASTIAADRSKPEIKPVIEIKSNGIDSFIVTKSDAIDKVQNDKQKNSTQKDEIRDLRIQRINKAILYLAQIFNYL